MLLGWTPLPADGQPVQLSPRTRLLRQAAAPSQAHGTPLRRPAAGHYDVIALRVEFQPDDTPFTTGDGTFAGALYGDLTPNVDPLPHDADYFRAHLAFLEDYVARVSDGRTTVTTHLVPEVVRVSGPMGAYSPIGPDADSDAELAKEAALVEEAWRLASAQSAFEMTPFDPARTAFVLFHAGVGYDVAQTGTTLDRTPEDLPSLFFDEAALQRLLGNPDITFKGFPVDHTIILPRTETRTGFNFITDEALLLELSINGLLAASFFNYLGVPDLFNTETGESAIGPFGLMDPLGFFAYSGLFPPAPCAWTRYYLGWTDPVELRGGGPQQVALHAAASQAGPSVAQARLSGAEYFLVENRHRDPEGDGLVLRVWQDGQVVEQRVQNADSTFNEFNTAGFTGGVVVGADHYDWALPGGVDEDGHALLGGTLIWHVDERRLAAGLPDNRVNADPARRSIDLEEADGAQDIGFPTQSPFGPRGGGGSPFDFFYEGNPVRVVSEFGREIRLYRNRFGPDTYPNSHSSEGGPSFIVLEDFSAPGAEMRFTYRQEAAAGVAPVALPTEQLEEALRMNGDAVSAGSSLAAAGPVLLLHTAGSSSLYALAPAEEGAVLVTDALTKPAVVREDAYATLGKAAAPDGNYYLRLTRVETTQTGPGRFSEDVVLPDEVTALTPAPPLVAVGEGDQQVYYVLFTGPGRSVVARVRDEDVTLIAVDELGEGIALTGSGAESVAVVGRRQTRILDAGLTWTYALPDEAELGQAVFGRDAGGVVGVIPVSSGELLLLLPDGVVERIDVADRVQPAAAAALASFPVLADLDVDGRLDVLTTCGARLVAFTQGGALVAGFPIPLSAPSVAQPLVAELTDSGAWSVVVASVDGYVYAYDTGRRGELVPGFPLAVGARVRGTPLLQEKTLYAVSEAGDLRAWQLADAGDVWWGQLYAGAGNQSYVALPLAPEPPAAPLALLEPSETYNYPNPITEGRTNLRFMVTRDCRVRITIVDLAGALVEEIEVGDVRGGVPAEYPWQPAAASGVYFARVQAVASDGEAETRLIKMAIIR